jgi:hypothetical protein
MHLVWVLRCERVIQGKQFDKNKINKRWNRVINKRLTTDQITTYKARRDKKFIRLAKNTWEKLLKQNGTLPENWFQNHEVLMGIDA